MPDEIFGNLTGKGKLHSGFRVASVLYSLPIPSPAPRPQGGASRARSGEQDVSEGSFVHIVPLNPARRAGIVGQAPATIILINACTTNPDFHEAIHLRR
jgi:hypothetical protein